MIMTLTFSVCLPSALCTRDSEKNWRNLYRDGQHHPGKTSYGTNNGHESHEARSDAGSESHTETKYRDQSSAGGTWSIKAASTDRWLQLFLPGTQKNLIIYWNADSFY